MNAAIIEKDFWVCWTMDYLFQHSKWKNHLAFKGGTSLSKSYGLIERFSEDIDLILDWRLLDFKLNEPWYERSKTKQQQFNKNANSKTIDFLQNKFVPSLLDGFKSLLDFPFNLYIDDSDLQTINFAYPQIFEDSSILKVIRLEIGVLAAWTPTKVVAINSYAAEQYPNIFTYTFTNILTVEAKRTFWEKTTILHREVFRTNNNLPERYSRHYYDMHCMGMSDIKLKAYSDIELLERVVAFKTRFYPQNSARYDLAKPGTMKLVPSKEFMVALNNDYNHMQNMIFGYIPSFTEIMESIRIMEIEINRL